MSHEYKYLKVISSLYLLFCASSFKFLASFMLVLCYFASFCVGEYPPTQNYSYFLLRLACDMWLSFDLSYIRNMTPFILRMTFWMLFQVWNLSKYLVFAYFCYIKQLMTIIGVQFVQMNRRWKNIRIIAILLCFAKFTVVASKINK